MLIDCQECENNRECFDCPVAIQQNQGIFKNNGWTVEVGGDSKGSITEVIKLGSGQKKMHK